MKHVTITTGSATRLIIDGREAPISSRKSMAMLVYVALQPGQVESRERIAARLWSDSGPDQARAALRQSLRRLILDLGPAGGLVGADRTAIRLTRPVALDVVEAKLEAERGVAPRLFAEGEIDLSRIFADFEDIDHEFNLWIAVQRERLVSQLVGRLEAALGQARTEIEHARLRRGAGARRPDARGRSPGGDGSAHGARRHRPGDAHL